jgi:hypothetical protein
MDRENCPHCGRPSLFPNVDLADDPAETDKLDTRFKEVERECDSRGCQSLASDFANACENSAAVFHCGILKLFRQTGTGTEVFETYHDLEQLRLQAGAAGKYDWRKLRPQAEIELLGSDRHLNRLHYACLSLNGQGLFSYGECAIQLREAMIAHRASCFEGNTAVLYHAHHGFSAFLRSSWQNRHKLCLAVLGSQIKPTTSSGEFAGILVEIGPQPEEDRFIEVHIFGPMTARTFEFITIDSKNHKPAQRHLRNTIVEKLNGITQVIIR